MYIKIILIIILLLFTIYLLVLSYIKNENFTSQSQKKIIPLCQTNGYMNDDINNINYNCPLTMCKFPEEDPTYTINFIFDYMFKILSYPLCFIKKLLC